MPWERDHQCCTGSGATTFLTENGRRGNVPPYARAPLAVSKATFSSAMTVMDKVEGWNEEMWVGSKFAASMWIYTKAALCDGRGRPPQDLRQMLRIIMASVSWVTEDFLWEHEWIMETNVTLKENDILLALNYDIDVLCPLQWGLLWFSAPSNLNRKFENNGTKVPKFRETVNNASELTCNNRSKQMGPGTQTGKSLVDKYVSFRREERHEFGHNIWVLQISN